MGKVGAFASQVGEFGFTQAGMLEQTRTMVDSYISKELVQDIPTGKLVVSTFIIVFMCSRGAGRSAGRRKEHGKDAIHVAHTHILMSLPNITMYFLLSSIIKHSTV